MTERISRKADELAQQCTRASVAIGTEPNWPVTAPIAVTLNTRAQNLTTELAALNMLESQLRVTRQNIKKFIDDARADMTQVDRATDMLYGPDSAKKIEFGLSPKKITHDPMGAVDQVIIRTAKDGTHPASIHLDWESVERAVYEVQWFSDSNMTQMLGSATVTSSETEIQGLERGKQYWFRVRAVRAGQEGPWSDQATRVANI